MPNFCTNCGQKIISDDQFCAGCGKPLILTRKVTPEPERVEYTEHSHEPEHLKYTECSPVVVQELPPEIKRWSWAAWLFNWVWAFARGLYGWAIAIFLVYLLAFVTGIVGFFIAPVGLFLCFFLGFKGNELDWKSRHYRNAAEFRLSHRRWEVTMWFIGYGLIGLTGLAIVAGTWSAVLQVGL